MRRRRLTTRNWLRQGRYGMISGLAAGLAFGFLGFAVFAGLVAAIVVTAIVAVIGGLLILLLDGLT